ncbi:MAG: putative nucleic acid-binding Zn ribbon protein [Sphingobacteriales bacterium]|jgi:predicted nucleic acid-binding Zn ribbon protein
MSNNQFTLKEALNKMIQAYRIEDKLSETELVNSWEKIVGVTIAKHTETVHLRGDILYVRVNSSALKHELTMAKTKLRDLLNESLGKAVIKEVMLT